MTLTSLTSAVTVGRSYPATRGERPSSPAQGKTAMPVREDSIEAELARARLALRRAVETDDVAARICATCRVGILEALAAGGGRGRLLSALTLAPMGGGSWATDRVTTCLAMHCAWQGELSDARTLIREPMGPGSSASGRGSCMWTNLVRGWIDLLAGDFLAAIARLRSAMFAAEEQTVVRGVANGLALAARAGLGEEDAALAGARALRERSAERQEWLTESLAGILIGRVELWQGEASAAARLDEVAVGVERRGLENASVLRLAPDLVEARIMCGRAALAEEASAALARSVKRNPGPWGVGAVRRCHGLLELERGDPLGSGKAFAEAFATFLGSGHLFDAGRAAYDLGRARSVGRQRIAAADAFAEAAARFEQVGAARWLERAVAREHSVRRRRSGALSPIERRVVRLAAGGARNAEIAHALATTVHAVEAHLSRSYRKLGVRSRRELVAVMPTSERAIGQELGSVTTGVL